LNHIDVVAKFIWQTGNSYNTFRLLFLKIVLPSKFGDYTGGQRLRIACTRKVNKAVIFSCLWLKMEISLLSPHKMEVRMAIPATLLLYFTETPVDGVAASPECQKKWAALLPAWDKLLTANVCVEGVDPLRG
jgi:hypothetical protein